MGNVREFGSDFPTLWKSEAAQEFRRYIAAGKCACPLANQSYANLLLHAPSAAKAAMAMMPDLGPAKDLVAAMQGVMSSGGNAFEQMQKVMGDFAKIAQHSMPGMKR